MDHYEITAERPDVKLSNYTADIFNTAGYAQVSINPFGKLVVTAGARYDNLKVNYNNAIDNSTGTKIYDKPTFKFGANYNPVQFTGIYANYAQGFAPPELPQFLELKLELAELQENQLSFITTLNRQLSTITKLVVG